MSDRSASSSSAPAFLPLAGRPRLPLALAASGLAADLAAGLAAALAFLALGALSAAASAASPTVSSAAALATRDFLALASGAASAFSALAFGAFAAGVFFRGSASASTVAAFLALAFLAAFGATASSAAGADVFLAGMDGPMVKGHDSRLHERHPAPGHAFRHQNKGVRSGRSRQGVPCGAQARCPGDHLVCNPCGKSGRCV